MHLFNHEKPYDRDRDGRLDAGEFAQWEMGSREDTTSEVAMSFTVSDDNMSEEEDDFEHPSPAYARQAIAEGRLADPEEIELCEMVLWEKYPQLHRLYDLDDLPSWKRMVKAMTETDPALGIAMWRTLLDSEEETAAELFPVLIKKEWLNQKDTFHLTPFIAALKQELFAKQIFQSAYVGGMQHALLEACCVMAERELAAHCLQLLEESQYPQSSWHMPLRRYREVL